MLRGRSYLLRDFGRWPGTDRLSHTPGVYEIVVLDGNGYPKPLSRVGGVDGRGVLYIGGSRRLRGRLNTLRRMLYEQRPEGHIAGMTYRASPRLKDIAPPSRLAFRFRHCADFRDEEDTLLRRYVRKFGEVPPLNARAEFISKGHA